MVAQREIGEYWTVEQYLEMEAWSNLRHEFVGGHVYAMAGGDQNHSSIGINVCAVLVDRLIDRPGNRCRVFNTDMKVRLANERDHVYSDASVTCDERDLADSAAAFIRYPRLVVEVLSDSTERYDRGAKFDLYRERGALYEYVLVSSHRMSVEVHSREENGSWTTVVYGPDSLVIIHSLDLALPIDTFYRGVAL
jgi:Uma2 family endonuclease